MRKFRKFVIVLMALVLTISAVGAAAQPAQASGCAAYHWVRHGETLAFIGRLYGVSWPQIAAANGIPRPFTIYPGQQLCIPYGYYRGGQPQYVQWVSAIGLQRTWWFNIVNVVRNEYVTIRVHNFPSNVEFQVKMGVNVNGRYQWRALLPLDSGLGGDFNVDIQIPDEFDNAYQLGLRIIQYKKNGKTFMQDQVFYNVAGWSVGPGGQPAPGQWQPPCYGHPPCWGVIPTIWITGVVRDTSVTITTRNWPAGVTFQVLMGPMGTRGIGGIPVGTLYSGAGGTLTATFPIPPALWGSRQIAIRTQNWPTGYYSYNWFYNNTTY